ncbi:MAG: hypothetical protein ACE5NA_09260 [Nitrospiraceae bacterium]
MGTIEEIKAKIGKYPELSYEANEVSITVHPSSPNGFSVRMEVHKRGFTVHFDGWHEEFTSEDDALKCFAFGLSSKCRLKVHRRSGFAYKWTVEYFKDGAWKEDSTTGLLLFPFWGSLEVVILQNDLVSD